MQATSQSFRLRACPYIPSLQAAHSYPAFKQAIASQMLAEQRWSTMSDVPSCSANRETSFQTHAAMVIRSTTLHVYTSLLHPCLISMVFTWAIKLQRTCTSSPACLQRPTAASFPRSRGILAQASQHVSKCQQTDVPVPSRFNTGSKQI